MERLVVVLQVDLESAISNLKQTIDDRKEDRQSMQYPLSKPDELTRSEVGKQELKGTVKEKEKARAKKKAYYEMNKQKILAKRRQYYAAHKTEIGLRRRAAYRVMMTDASKQAKVKAQRKELYRYRKNRKQTSSSS